MEQIFSVHAAARARVDARDDLGVVERAQPVRAGQPPARARAFGAVATDVGVITALEQSSRRPTSIGCCAMAPSPCRKSRSRPIGSPLTEAMNQIPTTLLFKKGELIDRKLGAQSVEELTKWVGKQIETCVQLFHHITLHISLEDRQHQRDREQGFERDKQSIAIREI